jgi:hypothetical protein
MFQPSENDPPIDLLKIPGTKEKANLYVTTLVQLLYSMEELVALQPGDTYDDDRYKLIQGNNFIVCMCNYVGFFIFRSCSMQV